MTETSIYPALIAATGAFVGIFATQGLTAWVKRNDEKRLLNGRLATLRATVRAELTQLIDVIEGEKEFAKTADWTWLPARDYFTSFRSSQDIIGMLENDEVESLTYTTHVFEERMGYIYRRALETLGERAILPELGAPIGRNIYLVFKKDQNRASEISDDEERRRRDFYQGNLEPILNAAKPALAAFRKNIAIGPVNPRTRKYTGQSQATTNDSESVKDEAASNNHP